MPEPILKKKPLSDNMDFTYTGDLNENGLPHGKGTQESLGWGKYVGTFEFGQRPPSNFNRRRKLIEDL